jgi:hypothetical protein
MGRRVAYRGQGISAPTAADARNDPTVILAAACKSSQRLAKSCADNDYVDIDRRRCRKPQRMRFSR